jgi:hypothetical protein
MNETLLLNLYNKYNLSSKGDFNTFKSDMSNPIVRQNFFNKYNLASKGNYQTFESDLLGANKNLTQTPVQQQSVAPKPTPKPQEEETFLGGLANSILSRFKNNDEEKPEEQKVNPVVKQPVVQQPVLNNYVVNKAELPVEPNLKTAPSEFAKKGYNPNKTLEQQLAEINDLYDPEKIKKTNQESIKILSDNRANNGLNIDKINFLIQDLPNKLRKNEILKQSKINTVLAQKNNQVGVVQDPEEKQTYLNQYKQGINLKQKELDGLNNQNIFDDITKTRNANTDVLTSAINNDTGSLLANVANAANFAKNVFTNYMDRKNKIDDLQSTINQAKKSQEYLSKYSILLNKTKEDINSEDLPQLASAYDPSIKGHLKSSNKYQNKEDITNYFDLSKGGFNSKEVALKNIASDNQVKQALEKTYLVFKKDNEILNAANKDNLQNLVAKNKWQQNINVYDNKFNSLIENYYEFQNNPELKQTYLKQYYSDPKDQERVSYLMNTPDFKNIIKNEVNLAKIGKDAINQNLKSWKDQNINNLQALNAQKVLNERQQLSQDYIEQQAKDKGLLSRENVYYTLQQLSKAGGHIGEYVKKNTGAVLSTILPDSETARQLEYSKDLWDAINYSQDDENLSVFDKGVKWISLPAKNKGNYQLGIDKDNNLVDIRANDLSLPVKGEQKKVIENYYYNNIDNLKTQAKDLSQIPGGKYEALKNLAKTVGVGVAEEVPELAVEAGLTAATEGVAAPLLESGLLKLGMKINDVQKVMKNYNKVSGHTIDVLTSYAEIKHDVQKDYEDRGLDPSLLNTVITSQGLAGVGQLSNRVERGYRKFGSELLNKNLKEQPQKVFVEDIPKVIKTLRDDVADIKNPVFKEYLFNKNLRNYAVAKYTERAAKVAKEFGLSGLQEASEETILEPLAQVILNQANANLTGNQEYNNQSLQELGFLDPETALIAGLTGGVMSSAVDVAPDLLNKVLKRDNGLSSIDALHAAVNDPNKFKSLLSQFVETPNSQGKSLTQEQFQDLSNSLDKLKTNYENTKNNFKLDEDFISKLNFDNVAHKSILESLGINLKNIENFKGSKTFENILLNSEVNKLNKEKVTDKLAQLLGVPNNNGYDLTPYLDDTGLFNYNKFNKIVGKDTLDNDTINTIQDYNQLVAKEKNVNNLVNLFNTNLGPVQKEFQQQYQNAIETNTELLNPKAQIINTLYQDNLFNKILNQQRIDRINELLSIGQGKEKERQLNEELAQLTDENNRLDKMLTHVDKTYKNGYFEAQENIKQLDEEYNTLHNDLKTKLSDYLSLNPIEELSDEKEKELNSLIGQKNTKLKELKKAHKDFNATYNNNIKSSVLDKNKTVINTNDKVNVEEDSNVDKSLTEEIQKDKETLGKVKEYREIFNKLKEGTVTKEDLSKLKSNNRLYTKDVLKETALPYYVAFSKEELLQAFNNDPDLLLGMYSILEDLGYALDFKNYKNINVDTLTGIVTDAIIKLNYNISLINNNKQDEIKNIDELNGALLINNYITALQEKAKEINPDSAPETIDNLGSDAQNNTIKLIEQNSKLKSDFNEEDITSTSYFIDDKEYKTVSAIGKAALEDNEELTAASNVDNLVISLGRVIFGNNNITKENIDNLLLSQMSIFAKLGIEFNVDKESYITLCKTLINQRDSLIKQGFKFVTEERVLFHNYDGINFTQNNNVIKDNTVGIATTMDIIAIDKNGKIDIINLRVSKNNEDKQNVWAEQLAFDKTILEKIPSIKINNVKVFSTKATYDIHNLGNKIDFLHFKNYNFKSINISNTILKLVNTYLSIPNLPVEVINTEEINTEETSQQEMPDYILEQQQLLAEQEEGFDISTVDMGPSLEDLGIEENLEPEEIGPSEFELIADISPVVTPVNLEENITTNESNLKNNSTSLEENQLDPNTQLITGQADKEEFEKNTEVTLGEFTDEPNSNIVSLQRVSYVKFNVTYNNNGEEQYTVSIINNNALNNKFNKVLNKEELKKAFKENNLFFSDKLTPNTIYILKNTDKTPVPSFQQENILSQQSYPESSILNSVYADDLTNQEGEIVVLDTNDKFNDTLKTEEDFRNKATLGVIVNNALVAIIPANKGTTKNAQVRNSLTITKEGGKFKVKPFKVKINKVKKERFLFNNNPIKIQNFLNKLNGFKSTIAFVAEIGKNKKLINPFTSKENSQLNIPATGLTTNGVFLILERSNNSPIIIPLKTPTLQEFFEGSNEELNMVKEILNNVLSNSFTSKDLKVNYNTFLNRLKEASSKNSTIEQLYAVIPKTINETSSNIKQKIKLENLKLNFTLDNVTDYLWDTLINLNETTKNFYSVDLDPENFYVDNYVILDYKPNTPLNTTNTTTTERFSSDVDSFCS